MVKPATNLSRETWVSFGLKKLREEGIDKLSIASLCRELSVTKGSFYWHFQDRDDLLQQMLNMWKYTSSQLSIDEVERAGGDALRRLKHISDIVFSRFGDQLKLDMAVREWGRIDLNVRKAVQSEDERRMNYLFNLFAEIFGDKGIARTKALLLYSLYIGENMIIVPKSEKSREDLLWDCLDSLLDGYA